MSANFLSGWFLEGVRKVSANFLEYIARKILVWKASGRYFQGVLKVLGSCPEGIWRVSGKFLEGVLRVSRGCLEGNCKVYFYPYRCFKGKL